MPPPEWQDESIGIINTGSRTEYIKDDMEREMDVFR